MSFSDTQQKPLLWRSEYIVENLPGWIYSDNNEPSCQAECQAKINSLEYTIKDIDLQIAIRELELKTGSSRHGTSYDFEKWKVQALRAKQTHMYLLNAYTYWFFMNQREDNKNASKLDAVIKLLIEEPKDFITQLENLL